MTGFATRRLAEAPDAIAPDGSEVRVLAAGERGSLAHFRLAAGQVSRAVVHRTVEEVWYVIEGRGEMWRQLGAREDVTPLSPGISLTIPLGATFQFRAGPGGPLAVVAVTMPPWPGEGEAIERPGPWTPTVSRVPADGASVSTLPE